ncbi:MAG: PDZ domain-containing protein [Candidatus Marinimicrobia bacterium]|nr:PDZ domain-containing protein [Candidatus Neomarinimicrobiota bacterium]
MIQSIKTFSIILLLSVTSYGKAVYYNLSMPEPHTHLFEVNMRLDGAKGKEIIAMPVWTPGSYLIREYAKNVQDISARSEDGTAIDIKKLDKNHWEIETKRGQDIFVSYRVYAYEQSVRTSYLNSDHALVVPAGVLMYWEKNENQQHFLHIDLPETWSSITTSLEPFNQPGNVDFIAENYDELVDSPLELGNHKVIDFKVMGKPHILAIYGASNYIDSVLIRDFTRIIEAEAEIFGGLPYEHYVFIVHAENGRGGLEHAMSSVNFINRWSFNDEKRYKDFLSLISHEFFHTWNVKRLYPQGVATFDYDNENYLDELWMAEGFTSYYDEMILQRIGIRDRNEYLETLKNEINSLESRPGKRHQSAAESSFDAWIKYYRPNEHSSNSTISYYNKGLLIGLLLDLKIIDATKGKISLDDVIRRLYHDFAVKQKGYISQDVRQACEDLSGLKLSDFFDDYVHGLESLPYAEVLDLAGLKLDSTKEKSAYAGVSLSEQSGRIMITNVVEGSPAWAAGLNVEDELLAIDGFRVKSVRPDYLNEKIPGDRIVCTLSRNGVLRDIQLTLGFSPETIERLSQVVDPTERQITVFEKWLGLSWVAETED